jgi:RNA-directed DNA polymerase
MAIRYSLLAETAAHTSSRHSGGKALSVCFLLPLTINEAKTSLRNARRERFDFLGYSFGAHFFEANGNWYLGASPSKKSVQRLKTRIGNLLMPSNIDPWPEVRDQLNRSLRGWSNYFGYGSRSKAYRSIDQ